MKKIWCLLSLTICFTAASAQVSENDTTIAAVAAQNRSIKLNANILPDGVDLEWSKGPDDFIGYFELYRSADGISYNIVKLFQPETFDANQNSSAYKDKNPLQGKNYYRLVGYDKFTHEKRTVNLVAEYKDRPRAITPTIVASGDQLTINNYRGQELELVVYNTGATPLFKRVVSSAVVPLPGNLASGVYVYQLADRKRSIISSGKFVLQ